MASKIFGYQITLWRYIDFWFPVGAQATRPKQTITSKDRWADKVDALVEAIQKARHLKGSHATIEIFRKEIHNNGHGQVTIQLKDKATKPTKAWMKREHGGSGSGW